MRQVYGEQEEVSGWSAFEADEEKKGADSQWWWWGKQQGYQYLSP